MKRQRATAQDFDCRRRAERDQNMTPNDLDSTRKARPLKKRQFSLRSLLVAVMAASAITGFVVRFPQMALIAAVVMVGVAFVGFFFVAMIAEAAFWDWLAAKLDRKEDRKN